MGLMDELIRQIRIATAAGLYYLALYGALALPDICGALGSENGIATGPRYRDWLSDNVPERAGDAHMIWGLRCSLMHQGRALPHRGRFPAAFVNGTELHNVGFIFEEPEQGVTIFSIPMFVEEVTEGAERWLQQFGATKTVMQNLERFARLHPHGLPPFVVGVPVFA